MPPPKGSAAWREKKQRDEQKCRENPDIVDSFFQCITSKRPGAVYASVMRGPVCANTPQQGETPLLAAIRVSDETMLRNLISLGAHIDGYGVCQSGNGGEESRIERTALQFAVAEGELTIVKTLLEFGADKSLIASDGESASSLAHKSGQQDIIDLLVSTRGASSSWKRWMGLGSKSETA